MADNAALDALYQEIILDHNRRPRNFRELPNATCSADGKNPNCGDALTIWLQFEGDTVVDISFQGVGCAISKASASLMTLAIKGRTRTEAAAIFEKVHGLVTGTEADAATAKELGQLRVLGGVSKVPMRVKCASLAWHALKSAMDGSEPVVAVHTGDVTA